MRKPGAPPHGKSRTCQGKAHEGRSRGARQGSRGGRCSRPGKGRSSRLPPEAPETARGTGAMRMKHLPRAFGETFAAPGVTRNRCTRSLRSPKVSTTNEVKVFPEELRLTIFFEVLCLSRSSSILPEGRKKLPTRAHTCYSLGTWCTFPRRLDISTSVEKAADCPNFVIPV